MAYIFRYATRGLPAATPTVALGVVNMCKPQPFGRRETGMFLPCLTAVSWCDLSVSTLHAADAYHSPWCISEATLSPVAAAGCGSGLCINHFWRIHLISSCAAENKRTQISVKLVDLGEISPAIPLIFYTKPALADRRRLILLIGRRMAFTFAESLTAETKPIVEHSREE